MLQEVFLFQGGQVRRDATLAEAARLIQKATPGEFAWVDCDTQSAEADAFLADTLHLHRLTQEDVWTAREAPKAEAFPGYLFVLVHGVRLTGSALGDKTGPKVRRPGDVAVTEIDCVLGPNWLFTHHPKVAAVAAVREEMMLHLSTLAQGPHVLLHAVLDRVVDLHAPVLDAVDRAIEALEDESLRARPPRSSLRRLLDLRRLLHRLRRSAVHQREVLFRLGRGDFERLPKDALPFFRDIHDHYVRVADLLDDDRDMLASVLEAWMSTHSFRMNEIMKVLTLISTLMLPITFIAGVYGMNFQFLPELHWKYGYFAALGLMALVAGSLLLWFKRRGWFE